MPQPYMEEWRDVVGMEGCYQVSSLGRVKSLARRIWFGTRWCSWREKILIPQRGDSCGHMKLTLCPTGRRVQVLIHRVVLEAFVGPCPAGMESCHFPDRDRSNNRLDNLRWDTHLANMNDRRIHGSLTPEKMRRTFSAETRAKMSLGIRRAWAARRAAVSQ